MRSSLKTQVKWLSIVAGATTAILGLFFFAYENLKDGTYGISDGKKYCGQVVRVLFAGDAVEKVEVSKIDIGDGGWIHVFLDVSRKRTGPSRVRCEYEKPCGATTELLVDGKPTELKKLIQINRLISGGKDNWRSCS